GMDHAGAPSAHDTDIDHPLRHRALLTVISTALPCCRDGARRATRAISVRGAIGSASLCRTTSRTEVGLALRAHGSPWVQAHEVDLESRPVTSMDRVVGLHRPAVSQVAHALQ